MSSYRAPGSHIEVAFMIGRLPERVMPLSVVEDSPKRIIHRLVGGTRFLRRVTSSSTDLPRVASDTEIDATNSVLVEDVWRSNHQLVMVNPQRANAIRAKYDADSGAFTGWYVNLQQPLARTEYGFWTIDDFLDIRVAPDRTYELKDIGEITEALERGVMPAEVGERVWAEAHRVIEDIRANAWPFNATPSVWDWDPDSPTPTCSHRWFET